MSLCGHVHNSSVQARSSVWRPILTCNLLAVVAWNGYVAVALTKVQMASKEGEVSLCMRARVQVCKL